jgi:hypothetical protein
MRKGNFLPAGIKTAVLMTCFAALEFTQQKTEWLVPGQKKNAPL